jgi:Ribbon-helix-helix protein, copG family
VKRLQISIDDDLDEALDRRCAEEGVSKAALIRRFVRKELEPLPALEQDPLWSFVGAGDFEPGDVDDVVYR